MKSTYLVHMCFENCFTISSLKPLIFTLASPLRHDVAQSWVYCGEPECVHLGQGQKNSPSPHNHQWHWPCGEHYSPLSSAMRECSLRQPFPRVRHLAVLFVFLICTSVLQQSLNWEMINPTWYVLGKYNPWAMILLNCSW